MALMRSASACVIRCFKNVEHVADVLTGAAGPVFIALAWALTGTIGFSFFDVIARDMSWPVTILLLPLYILVPTNMYVQYYLVTHINGGYPASKDPKDNRWITPNPHSLFAPERWGFHKRGPSTQPPVPKQVRRCRKCDGPKPERSHHCSVCKRCVMLMDHHCPWINACVGLHNQRHFVLFMLWLAFGAGIFSILGYGHFWASINFYTEDWSANTPRVIFTLAWVLAVACGGAVLVLGSWHLFMVMRGETSIESHDNGFLEKKAKEEGLIYLNPFDLGKRRNLENFFNIGPNGYSKLTLLFPLVVPPYTNGWSYPRRSLPELGPDHAPLLQHAEDRQGEPNPEWLAQQQAQQQAMGHNFGPGDGPGGLYVMGGGDDLTDDEGGGGGWWNEDENEPHHAGTAQV